MDRLTALRYLMLCILGLLPAVTALRLSIPDPDSLLAQVEYDYTDYLVPDIDDLSKSLRPKWQGEYREPIRESEALDEILHNPLFSPGTMTFPEVSRDLNRSKATGGGAVMFYHKTGCALIWGLTKKLGLGGIQLVGNNTKVSYTHGKRLHSFYEGSIYPHKGWVAVGQPSNEMVLWNGVPSLHLYRNPISKLLSAYRYHKGEATAERWEGDVAQCQHCTEDEAKAIFSACDYNCSYFELLNKVDKTRGILLEALMSRQQLEHSIVNLQRWANNPDVLHLSVDHLATDFEATMKCLLAFLHLDEDPYLSRLQGLDISKYPNRHTTRGRYDNSDLKTYLETHAQWGPQFKAIRQLEDEIWRRQSVLYGCPVPA